MVNRVVSTKLTEEEHATLLDACNNEGLTPSSFIRAVLMDTLRPADQQARGLEESASTAIAENENPEPKERSSTKEPGSEIMKLIRMGQKQRIARENL
jgi:hypothetical protein